MEERRAHKGSSRALKLACSAALGLCLVASCATAAPNWWPWKKTTGAESASAQAPAPPAPRDNAILRTLGLDRGVDKTTFGEEMEAAKRLYQNKEYAKAEAICHSISTNKKAPINFIEDALYHEADCQRLQGNYRDAEATYMKYLKDFRTQGQYTDQVLKKLFDIANYWLDDTRKQMQAQEEAQGGKRWFVAPAAPFHFGKDKPLMDAEGHALRVLEEIRLTDIRGPLGEKSLFYIATVKFFREDYRDADYYYAQLYEQFPNSQLAAKAMKQSIICKQIMHGGTDYDTRSVEESRKLIDTFQTAYPEWSKDREWLTRQLSAVHLQQADRDFKVAEFYQRTGHPGSAYFYYELVKRRYAGTEYAKKAETQLASLRGLATDNKEVVTSETQPRTASQERWSLFRRKATNPDANVPAGATEVTNAFSPTPPAPQPPAPPANAFAGSRGQAAAPNVPAPPPGLAGPPTVTAAQPQIAQPQIAQPQPAQPQPVPPQFVQPQFAQPPSQAPAPVLMPPQPALAPGAPMPRLQAPMAAPPQPNLQGFTPLPPGQPNPGFAAPVQLQQPLPAPVPYGAMPQQAPYYYNPNQVQPQAVPAPYYTPVQPTPGMHPQPAAYPQPAPYPQPGMYPQPGAYAPQGAYPPNFVPQPQPQFAPPNGGPR